LHAALQADRIALRTRARNPLNDLSIEELGVPANVDVDEVRRVLTYREFIEGVQAVDGASLQRPPVARLCHELQLLPRRA
jgi:hypothetical protein